MKTYKIELELSEQALRILTMIMLSDARKLAEAAADGYTPYDEDSHWYNTDGVLKDFDEDVWDCEDGIRKILEAPASIDFLPIQTKNGDGDTFTITTVENELEHIAHILMQKVPGAQKQEDLLLNVLMIGGYVPKYDLEDDTITVGCTTIPLNEAKKVMTAINRVKKATK